MNDMLKSYYYSDLCEISRPAAYTEEAAYAGKEKDRLYNELREKLSDEDFSLFEEYIEKKSTVDSEDEYRAFCCGIRTAIRFVADAFTSI